MKNMTNASNILKKINKVTEFSLPGVQTVRKPNNINAVTQIKPV